MLEFPTREALYRAMPQGGRVAEIGVFQGENAVALLKIMRPRLLLLVDCWDTQHGDYESDPLSSADFADCYLQTVQRFNNNPEVNVLKCYSLVAAAILPNSWFDFIYIDADHNYQPCLDDIRAFWPKVRSGGYLGGHDYTDRFGWIQCKRAVDEFCNENRLSLSAIIVEEFPSWVIRRGI